MGHTLSKPMFPAVTLGAVVLSTCFLMLPAAASQTPEPPNIVVLFADDLGYGDLGSYGHPTIRTPNLDRMAAEGVRLTSFYAGAPSCTPSRAALLTGRYPLRSGLPNVLGPESENGLPASEVTLAEALKSRGYRTMAVGKWHLGHASPQYLPTANGFDAYFGLPYSNDMIPPWVRTDDPLRFRRDEAVLEEPVDQSTLTKRYTEEGVEFIRSAGENRFFLYLAYSMPHVPLSAADEFRGDSRAGLYGDVIQAVDWSAGRILETLDETGAANQTLVFFASDNGPWLNMPDRMYREDVVKPWHAGSPGPLRGAKGTTYEGGVRVPAIFRWPDGIPSGRTTPELVTAMDVYATLVALAGAEVPPEHTLDGRDILPLLRGQDTTGAGTFYYLKGTQLEAVRQGKWKFRFSRNDRPELEAGNPTTPELFDLEVDPSERYNRAGEYPEIIRNLAASLLDFAGELGARVEEGLGSLARSGTLGISPYPENPWYWQYQGRPILLLGGSVEDNLFQTPDLEEHLDLLKSVGGNYVRCTMSSRDDGNVWAFGRDPQSGLYDLSQPNPEYWDRFEHFLKLTAEREIIVQIEVWATFDYYDGETMGRPFWQQNPFNPRNNHNYTSETSGLPEVVDSHPVRTRNPFFRTVPRVENNQTVLQYQQAFVEKLLSHTFRYGHVLYCMDNETSVTPEWGAYWARFIRGMAESKGVNVQVTEMWDPWDLSHEMHSNTFDHPELYSFVDISQNNHQKGQAHWDNAQRQRARVLESGRVRPLNNVKIYGADSGRFGDDRDGIERFWRNTLGGLASARFHRPDSGLGLSETAQSHIRSARLFSENFNLFESTPRNDLLGDRTDNEAYCTAIPGQAYAVFFPQGGEVTLDVSAAGAEDLFVRWLDIDSSAWKPEARLPSADSVPLKPPGEGYWLALVTSR